MWYRDMVHCTQHQNKVATKQQVLIAYPKCFSIILALHNKPFPVGLKLLHTCHFSCYYKFPSYALKCQYNNVPIHPLLAS